jgi:hypothetical protein
MPSTSEIRLRGNPFSYQFAMDTVQKQIAQAPVNGKVRVIICGLNQAVFQGRFATVNAPASGVSNVAGADLDGSPVPVTVQILSPPGPVKVMISRK